MPKPRKYELIRCVHFAWRLKCRDGVWYADGRSNEPDVGRHSLGTTKEAEARRRLIELDVHRAADFGLIPRPDVRDGPSKMLSLAEGRKLYEEHLGRSAVTGGVRASTRKRYRTVFDKFLAFAQSIGVATWNGVDKRVLDRYATHLESTGYETPSGNKKAYRYKTLHNELTTPKQCFAWMIKDGHLSGEKINLPLQKAESERPYCWRVEEVAALIEYCRQQASVMWLRPVIIGLACTGLRISELASLRWYDIDLERQQLSLTDETAHSVSYGYGRRQTKSGRSRCFPIHPHLLEVLARMPRKDVFVYRGPRGGRLKPDTVRNVLIGDVLEPLATRFPSPAGRKGFKDGRLHSFRHYFCSRCANSGVPERMVMEWLGHADSSMVRHYYHLNDEEARRQMESLDLLGEAGKRFTGVVERTASSKKKETSPDRESSTAIGA